MASPQKENGFTPIANELIEALAQIRISGEAMQILWVILRKTYGFQKKEDAISLSQFCQATGMKKQAAYRAVCKLLAMNIITKKDYGMSNKYCLIKDFTLWNSLPKKMTVTQKDYAVTKKDDKSNQKRVIQKKKETIQKKVAHPTLSEDVPVLIDLFQLLNPAYKKLFGSPPQRRAADNLLKMHEVGWWKRFMPAYQAALEDRFCPRATTPVQMENKIGDIDIYGRQRKKSQETTKHKIAF